MDLSRADFRERRAGIRFPLNLDVSYKSVRGKRHKIESGRTLNISSRGVLFSCDSPPNVGESIELTLNWPVKIGGVCQLKLVLKGKVARVSGNYTAMRVGQYEFRTIGKRIAEESPLTENSKRVVVEAPTLQKKVMEN